MRILLYYWANKHRIAIHSVYVCDFSWWQSQPHHIVVWTLCMYLLCWWLAGDVPRSCEASNWLKPDVSAGRSYAISSQRMLIASLESVAQKCQSGVVIHFEKIGPDIQSGECLYCLLAVFFASQFVDFVQELIWPNLDVTWFAVTKVKFAPKKLFYSKQVIWVWQNE